MLRIVSSPDAESKMSSKVQCHSSDGKTSLVSENGLELNMGVIEKDEDAVDRVTVPSLTAEHAFPDGGYKAWMTVLGGWLSFIAGIGVLTGFAVFQSYYSTVVLTGYSANDIAWIGSLQTWGCYFFGLWAGRLSDRYGPKVPMAFGSLFMIVGTMTASLSTKYYQFVLSQGLCSALGIGFAFTPALAVQSQWFLKRRGFVVGMVMSGQNVGGTYAVCSCVEMSQ
jgi:MFS family permease